jgi:hypothetical protein
VERRRPPLFADYARIFRGVSDREAGEELSERSTWFRAFLVWITSPPMVLLAFDQGEYLVIVYANITTLSTVPPTACWP